MEDRHSPRARITTCRCSSLAFSKLSILDNFLEERNDFVSSKLILARFCWRRSSSGIETSHRARLLASTFRNACCFSSLTAFLSALTFSVFAILTGNMSLSSRTRQNSSSVSDMVDCDKQMARARRVSRSRYSESVFIVWCQIQTPMSKFTHYKN